MSKLNQVKTVIQRALEIPQRRSEAKLPQPGWPIAKRGCLISRRDKEPTPIHVGDDPTEFLKIVSRVRVSRQKDNVWAKMRRRIFDA
jgi:hypothetical protein